MREELKGKITEIIDQLISDSFGQVNADEIAERIAESLALDKVKIKALLIFVNNYGEMNELQIDQVVEDFAQSNIITVKEGEHERSN